MGQLVNTAGRLIALDSKEMLHGYHETIRSGV
jgi:hypothetical protein